MLTFTIDHPPAVARHRPAVRAGVARAFNAYATETRLGRVVVEAWPHRALTEARQIARRIHRDPEGYLWAARTFAVPGVSVVRTRAAATAAA